MRTMEKSKGKNEGRRDYPVDLFRGRHDGRRGQEPHPPALNSSASALLSSSRYLRSRISHSDPSLPTSSSARTSLPTSTVERKSSTAWLRLPSAIEPALPPPAARGEVGCRLASRSASQDKSSLTASRTVPLSPLNWIESRRKVQSTYRRAV